MSSINRILKVMVLFSLSLSFLNWQSIFFTEPTYNESQLFLSEQNKTQLVVNNQETDDSIDCFGHAFDTFPDLSRVKNEELKAILNDVQKLVVHKSLFQSKYQPVNRSLVEYLYKGSQKIHFNSFGYRDLCTRIDGEKVTWAPVAQIPTNGKFIMMVFVNWEDEGYDPPSRAFFLYTFNLSGEVQSIVYIYGQEEFRRNKTNTDKLTGIYGRAYGLSTDSFFVRKGVIWDQYDYRDGFSGCTLNVSELRYIIDKEGRIKCEEEKTIFPKKHTKWKEREKVGIPFYYGTDTVKKLLGEID